MFSTTTIIAVAALLFAPLDTMAGSIYRRMGEVRVVERDDPQSSFTLDPGVVQPSGELTGQEGGGDPGQAPSLTSKNNFINFCLTQNVPLTDGKQIPTGSCDPIPMGRIAAKDRQPAAKFVFPPNLDKSLKENQPFTIQLAVVNLATGTFTNPNTKYYAAPQTVDGDGNIIGHSHVTIQALPSLDSTVPLDANIFAFFKGLNAQAVNGILSTDVAGLPAGFYRICSINSSANHQPVLVSNAQRGSSDDCSYFTVCKNDGGDNNNGGNNDNHNNDGGNHGQH